MPIYQLQQTQGIAASLEQVWEFISSPGNLKTITPPAMGFEVTSGNGHEPMYEGMIITYKVSPLLGIRLDWMTEITHVRPLDYFVDEQRMGPYRIWHHEHRIWAVEGGVMMSDKVTYVPPMGILGAVANVLVIKSALKEIFDFRNAALEKRFGVLPPAER